MSEVTSALISLLLAWSTIGLWLMPFLLSRFGGDRKSGAFKRMMTYTYLISLPCASQQYLQAVHLRTNHDNIAVLIVYSIGMMTIKYREGYTLLPGYGSTHALRYRRRSWKLTYIHLPVIPTPYQLWTPTDQALLMKFYMIFAVAWGLEMCRNTPLVC